MMDYLTGLSQQVAEVSQQNNGMALSLAEARKEIAEVHKENAELRKLIEDLEVQMHQIREQRVTEAGIYLNAAMRGAKTTTPEGLTHRLSLPLPRAEELFYTIDISRAEGGERAMNIPELRQRIENEIQKSENKTFQCKAVVKDQRTPYRVRILCRSEEELDVVKKAATEVTTEGVRILRDQLYPVKVNNARANAVLQPDGTIQEDIVSILNDSISVCRKRAKSWHRLF